MAQPDNGNSTVIARAQSAQNVMTVVRRADGSVDLEVKGATFATWHPTRLCTGYSWDALAGAAVLGNEPRSVLLLGLGAGTVARILRALAPDARIVGVELDPVVLELATAHLSLGVLDVDIKVDDAFAYVSQTSERFDVVIDDLFVSGEADVVRASRLTGAYLERLVKLLRPGGRVVANHITDGGHEEGLIAARRAFARRFEHVAAVLPPRGLNEVLVGSHAPLERAAWESTIERVPAGSDRDTFGALRLLRLGQNAMDKRR